MPLKAMSDVNRDLALSYVQRYFSSQKNGRPLYSGSRFETFAGGGDIVEPNRITHSDLIAVSMLSVHVPAQAAIGITGTHAEEIEELLTRIPTDVALESLSEFEPYLGPESATQKLWDLLRQNHGTRWGLGPTTTSKIMARKRPQLVPVLDSVVSKARKGNRTRNYWFDWFEAFKEPGHEDQIGELQKIRAESGQHHLSLVRVLDIILWMHRPESHEVKERVGDDDT
ncbi:DUF6308 family protein [Citricoccus alkalitolerans]|uniref:DUF6308 family protein n=1 Tax=Citricoccus alkalitolerans TaxID=246603 RepID=A0ABV8XV91_9MICC